jgi:hypothetical protein
MLIDEFLPDYDVRERHRITIHAPVETVYAAVRRLDISQARFSMFLFRLRGIAANRSSHFTIDDLLKMRFILLGEKPHEELLLGLVGRFWTPSGELRRLNAAEFRQFNEQSYAKAVWNFSVSQRADGAVQLETETRVYCLGEVSRWRFRWYWRVMGSFSGLVRRDVLKAVKRSAEKLPSRAA